MKTRGREEPTVALVATVATAVDSCDDIVVVTPALALAAGDMDPHVRNRDSWAADSGATRHITFDVTLMHNPKPVTGRHTIQVGDGATLAASHVGDIRVPIMVGGAPRTITLQDVLYVPNFTHNLFSVRLADKKGFNISIANDMCRVTKNDFVWIEAPGSNNGLYTFTAVKGNPDPTGSSVALLARETPELWHRRLGHLGYANLVNLQRHRMVQGISVTEAEFRATPSAVCEPCVLAKQVRKPFPSSTRKSTRVLELLHMDVCGPLPESSLGGNRYFATFLDDFSHLSVVKVLPTKSAVIDAVMEVVLMLETQSDTKLRAVRTDNGGEYVNDTLLQFYKSKGITHEKTAPYTPEQNGAAERLNRTLMDRSRAMLLDAHLPQHLWAEAVVTANYIRNRSPVTSETKTPWELFYGSPPDVSHMRVFGCNAYAHIPKTLRRKLDSVCEKGIFVGYAPNSKAYRVLLNDSGNNGGKVVTRRDVTFNEFGDTVIDITGAASTPVTSHTTLTDEEEEQSADDEFVDAAGEEEELDPGVDAGDNAGDNRRSARIRRRPGNFWMVDQARIAQDKDEDAPTYEEAMNGPNREQWLQALKEEIASLASNGTWELKDLPAGIKALPVRWVLKVKRDAKGNIERYKARLVVKGYMQREGIDFNEVFAPTSKHTTLRTLLAIVAADDLELEQLDVKTAFLNGDLEEELYMKQPPGFEEGGPELVCYLHKALYGLRQAPRAWHEKLKTALETMDFVASEADPGLFILRLNGTIVYILVYVDDLLVAGKDKASVDAVKKDLQSVFDIRDLGNAGVFIGIEIVRDRAAGTLKIMQRRMAADLVAKYGLADGKTKSTPMSSALKMTRESGDALDTQQFAYSELVGSLLYLSVCTRPDITQAVGALSRYMSKPTVIHWQAGKALLRYLSGTLDYGIYYDSKSALLGYCDSDYAGDIDTRRSTTGYVFILNGGVIDWSSRLQPTVAASTTEAEYMAAGSAVKAALFMRKLLGDFGQPIPTVQLMCDNQAAITLLKHPISSVRSKHIDVIWHFSRERVARKEVAFQYVSTDKMLADTMTKPLPESSFSFCRAGMGMRS